MWSILLALVASSTLSVAHADSTQLIQDSEGWLPREIPLISPVELGQIDGKHGVILAPTDKFLSAPKWEQSKELPLSLNEAITRSLIALEKKSKVKLTVDDLDSVSLRRHPTPEFRSNLYYHVLFWPRQELIKFNYKARQHVIVLLDGSVFLPEYLPLSEHMSRLQARCPAQIDNAGKVTLQCKR